MTLNESGAYNANKKTTAIMMKDIGSNWVLTGHSERRTQNTTTDKDVAVNTKLAIENGTAVVVCIGEGFNDREMGMPNYVNAR